MFILGAEFKNRFIFFISPLLLEIVTLFKRALLNELSFVTNFILNDRMQSPITALSQQHLYLVFPLAQYPGETFSPCSSLKPRRFSWEKSRWEHKNVVLNTSCNPYFDDNFSLVLCNVDRFFSRKIHLPNLETLASFFFCFIHFSTKL